MSCISPSTPDVPSGADQTDSQFWPYGGNGLLVLALRFFGILRISLRVGLTIHSVARNPSISKQLFGYAILGFALSEAMALFALLVAFLILFALPVRRGHRCPIHLQS